MKHSFLSLNSKNESVVFVKMLREPASIQHSYIFSHWDFFSFIKNLRMCEKYRSIILSHIKHIISNDERELSREAQICICMLIDYKKVLDNVKHERLIEKLKLAGMDGKDMRMIARLYFEQAAVVQTDQGGFEIRRGTSQGCVLSPYLLNLFTELIFRAIESEDEGVSVGDRRISDLRYADDTAITAGHENEL